MPDRKPRPLPETASDGALQRQRLHGLMERLEETGIGLLARQAAQESPAPSPDGGRQHGFGELVAELKQQHAERQTQERRRDRDR